MCRNLMFHLVGSNWQINYKVGCGLKVELRLCSGWLGQDIQTSFLKLHVVLQILRNVNPELVVKVCASDSYLVLVIATSFVLWKLQVWLIIQCRELFLNNCQISKILLNKNRQGNLMWSSQSVVLFVKIMLKTCVN